MREKKFRKKCCWFVKLYSNVSIARPGFLISPGKETPFVILGSQCWHAKSIPLLGVWLLLFRFESECVCFRSIFHAETVPEITIWWRVQRRPTLWQDLARIPWYTSLCVSIWSDSSRSFLLFGNAAVATDCRYQEQDGQCNCNYDPIVHWKV